MNTRPVFSLALLSLSLVTSIAVGAPKPAVPNSLTGEEIELGFELLFDGRSFEGWRNNGNWVLDGDAMYRETDGGGLVHTGRRFEDDFELRFEWRVTRASSSGVYYRPGQYEYQIVDNPNHADGRNPRTSTGALYSCMAPSKDVSRPAGRWNTGRIVCKGSVIQHWVNGVKVVDFDSASERWAENADLLSKRGGNVDARGTILHLQDADGPVWFRSIRYRSLLPVDDIGHETVTPAEISPEVLEAERETIEKLRERRFGARPQS